MDGQLYLDKLTGFEVKSFNITQSDPEALDARGFVNNFYKLSCVPFFFLHSPLLE